MTLICYIMIYEKFHEKLRKLLNLQIYVFRIKTKYWKDLILDECIFWIILILCNIGHILKINSVLSCMCRIRNNAILFGCKLRVVFFLNKYLLFLRERETKFSLYFRKRFWVISLLSKSFTNFIFMNITWALTCKFLRTLSYPNNNLSLFLFLNSILTFLRINSFSLWGHYTVLLNSFWVSFLPPLFWCLIFYVRDFLHMPSNL